MLYLRTIIDQIRNYIVPQVISKKDPIKIFLF